MTTTITGSTVGRRMMDKAGKFAAEDLDRDRQIRNSRRRPNNTTDDDDFDDDDNDDDGYDSDDPRSFGGSYYWMTTGRRRDAPIPLSTKAYDLGRFAAFYVWRLFGFVALVLMHFFGFQSRFQWAIDLADKEQARLEQDAVGRQQQAQ